MIEIPDDRARRGGREGSGSSKVSSSATVEDPTMDISTSSSKDTAPSNNRGPSAEFLKRRHQRMRGRATPEKELVVDTSIDDEESVAGSVVSSGASSTALRSFRQLREKRKNRVPGGAAAKLIGRPQEEPVASKSESEDRASPFEPGATTEECAKLRDEAKEAFTVGTKDNRRYHKSPKSADSPRITKSTSTSGEVHSVLNRDEAYHEDATASVISLLNKPEALKARYDGTDIMSLTSACSKDFEQLQKAEGNSKSFFQNPPRIDGNDEDSHSVSIVTLPKIPTTSEVVESSDNAKSPLEQPLLTPKAEERIARMKHQMIDPNSTLSDLIATIATPDDHLVGDTFSRGYMVRRKNACGALQVLTGKPSNRIKICWTVGVLPALSSVLEDSGDDILPEVIRDIHTRREFVEARKRAVTSLLNLATPQDNRLAMFHTPRLIPNVVRVIHHDHLEARKGCCAILAHLAKTKENRLLMVHVPGLIDAVTSVIEPKAFSAPTTQYSEDDREDADRNYDSDASSRSSDHGYDLRTSSTNEERSMEGLEIASSYSSGDDDANLDIPTTSTADSEMTPLGEDNPIKASRRYDADPNQHLHAARVNVFALFSHLVKEKDNAYVLARHSYLAETLVAISTLHTTTAHEHAVKMLAHLTRHRGNSKHIVLKLRTVVPALVKASFSQNDEARKHAIFALQNLAQDKPCRQELATTEGLLSAICVRVRQASDPEERLAAIHTLKNLTDEPANLIPMTNTPECLATLMQIAHASDDSVTEMMQYLGCDALATLSHWFRSIATSGERIEATKKGLKPASDLFVPSLKIVTFEQWK